MGIFDDSFSIGLKHPIDEESWKIIEDVELVNTERVYFTTPSGKRVDFIKADVLDKIRAEIEDLDVFYDNDYFSGNQDAMFKCNDVFDIIDKYKAESED